MGPRSAIGLASLAVALALASGCGGRHIEQGVFSSPKGYRATLPGPDWAVVESSRADLELRHRGAAAGMLVNATCTGSGPRRAPEALSRTLLLGLRDRRVIERGEATVGGRPAAHAVLEARGKPEGPLVRVETLTFVHGGCVYDLAYAASGAAFAALRKDFERFAASLTGD